MELVTEKMIEAGVKAFVDETGGFGAEDNLKTVRLILEAALSTDAEPVAQCCMCGKRGLSTKEGDGGTECELSDGRWVCSSDCWDKAVDPAPSVSVKALEWVKRGDGTFTAEPMEGVFRFHVWETVNGNWFNSSDPSRNPSKSEDEAKAFCQADYEARIRSALHE